MSGGHYTNLLWIAMPAAITGINSTIFTQIGSYIKYLTEQYTHNTHTLHTHKR